MTNEKTGFITVLITIISVAILYTVTGNICLTFLLVFIPLVLILLFRISWHSRDLKKLAHFDALTGLPNRYSFIEELTRSIHDERKNKSVSVCFLDIDNFKFINNTLGHHTGDLVIKIIAELIAKNIGKEDYLARLGGDEFGIILYNNHSLDKINYLISQLLAAFNHSITIKQSKLNISLSIGISSHPEAGKSAEELIKNADIAMYHAKQCGKNTFTHFNDELREKVTRTYKIENELQDAIARNEFTLVYQPQVETLTQKIYGVEVLIRWNNHALGAVEPSEFIPIAERNGMIHAIGEWVLMQLEKERKLIITSFGKEIIFAVNVSVLQLADAKFYQTLTHIFDKSFFPQLIFEITESAFMVNTKETKEMMEKINKLGTTFSLDDFGIHYSVMRYLKNLPISQLKIDYIFVKDIDREKNDLVIVDSIIKLSNGLGLLTVAEGVETKEQLELLTSMGCKYVQGFYLYRPMLLDKLLIALETNKRHFQDKT